jgi:nitrite reductase/ring-hydroxylating ferredoxin subunit
MENTQSSDEIVLCSDAELAENCLLQAMAGDVRILLCRIEGEVHALDGICPHRGASLAQGQCIRNAVVCPWHDWAFDLVTGKGITNPYSSLKKYPVFIKEGNILISTSSLESAPKIE